MGRLLVHCRESTFLKNGITLACFKGSGKIPVTKDWLIGLKIGILIVLEYFWEV